jgi:transcriptional regulator GlxA family with amidase domain
MAETQPATSTIRTQIAIVVFNGFDELDAIAPFEVLSRLAREVPDVDVTLVASGAPTEVVSAHGLRLQVADDLPAHAHYLVIPGGGWNDRAHDGVRAEVERGTLPATAARFHEVGSILASVCTGAMVLAGAGLLKGREATTHHSAIDDLRSAGAEVVDARVVDGEDILTAGGVTAGMDLALWLVERTWGREVAQTIADDMEYRSSGSVWSEQRRASQRILEGTRPAGGP